MHDSRSVRRRQSIGNLNGVLQGFGQPEAFLGNATVQRLALDVLHDDVVQSSGVADLVNRDDVGMIQSGGGLGLLDEALLPLWIEHLFTRQKLDRDGSPEKIVK